MAVKRMKTADGVLVDAANTDGQAAVRILSDGRAELTVLPARGTFWASIAVDREAARALAAELMRIGGAE